MFFFAQLKKRGKVSLFVCVIVRESLAGDAIYVATVRNTKIVQYLRVGTRALRAR